MVRHFRVEERDEAFKKAAAAGIVFADHEDKKRREAGVDRGEVLEVGPDAFKGYHLSSYGNLDNFKPWCKPGDTIAFAKYSGMVVKEGEKEYLVINDEDVVAILEETNE